MLVLLKFCIFDNEQKSFAMKKIYSSLICLFIAQSINAQTAIDAADFPVAGDAFAISYDDTTTAVNIGAASATSQTWDFTNLQMLYSDTFSYFNPALTPQGSAFPASDMAIYDKNSGIYSYFQHKAGGLVIKGISMDLTAAGFGVLNMPASPEEMYIKDPTAYGTTYNVNTKYEANFNKNSGDQDTVLRHHVQRSTTADAWGTVTTNFGTYDAIRVRSYEITADTALITYFGFTITSFELGRDTSIRYTYLIDTTGHPIVTVYANANDSITGVEFLTSNQVAPTAGFFADNTTVDVNQPVKFNDYSTAATSWEWDFGDGSAVSTLQSPTHAYSATGLYTVTQRVFNSNSSDTLEIVDYITVISAEADFFADDTTPTTGQTVNFTNTSVNSTSWKWDFGDGTATSTLENPTHSYANAGPYTVRLIAYNSFNSDTTTKVSYINVSSTTGIKENNTTVSKVYPNPANDNINFLFTNNDERTVQIFDVTGKCSATFNVAGNTISINTSLFKQGLYYYKITGNKSGIATGKFSVIK